MNYKTIKESIKAKNKALSLLLDQNVQCQNCKHCNIYHSIYKAPKQKPSGWRYYYGNKSKYEMKEDIHYYCRIKEHDVLKFAQCNKFDFQLDVG